MPNFGHSIEIDFFAKLTLEHMRMDVLLKAKNSNFKNIQNQY